MSTRVCFGVAAVLWLTATAQRLPAQSAPADNRQSAPRAVRDRYCITCHNARLKTGGLALDTADPGNVGQGVDVWEKVVRKVRAGMMPPPRRPAPSDEERRALVSALEGSLDRFAQATPQPGRPLVHRLNRAEYANAVRDLLVLVIDPAP